MFEGEKECYSESDSTNPISYYGKSKLLSEQVALSVGNSVVIRTSLVYGYSENLSRLNFPLWLIEKLKKSKIRHHG